MTPPLALRMMREPLHMPEKPSNKADVVKRVTTPRDIIVSLTFAIVLTVSNENTLQLTERLRSFIEKVSETESERDRGYIAS